MAPRGDDRRLPPTAKRNGGGIFFRVATLHLKCIVCVLYLGPAQAEGAVIQRRRRRRLLLLLSGEEGMTVVLF